MEPLASASYREALARRRDMEERLVALERALAAATAASGWSEAVREKLVELNDALIRHVVAVEATDGLLDEIVSTAPRLANSVQLMRDDHGRLAARIERLINEARILSPDGLRDDAVGLLHEMMLHRQRGSDLVYEAFSRDIGGLDS
jgi:hypothetical protein